MKKEHLVTLFDRAYAAAYEAKFLTSEIGRSDAEYELRLLQNWLTPEALWLVVACGTGYFLRHFPHIERAGLDLSPAMLDIAREANPEITLIEGSYLEPHPEWRDAWDVVSCIWYAYGLVSSMDDLELLVSHLADWTSIGGRCFLPLAHPQLILGTHFQRTPQSPWPGEVEMTGIVWSCREESGAKMHAHQFAPTVEHMIVLLKRHFATVDLDPCDTPTSSQVGTRSRSKKGVPNVRHSRAGKMSVQFQSVLPCNLRSALTPSLYHRRRAQLAFVRGKDPSIETTGSVPVSSRRKQLRNHQRTTCLAH